MTSVVHVTLSCIYNVSPASPTPQPCWKSLSNIDLVAGSSFYSSCVHYYSPDHSAQTEPFHITVSKLKQSLGLTLNAYYVFAGRVQTGGDGRPQVNCNDAGIPLRITETDARFEDWNNNMAECSIEEKLNTRESFKDSSPLLQIQVTRFACGGIALGAALCETVADGHSMAEFFHAWSRVHCGLPITKPLFNANIFKARDPPSVTLPMRDYVAAENADYKYKVDPRATSYRKKTLDVTQAQVEDLVREIEAGPFGFPRASSFVALSALIWKSLTEARDLPDHVITKYLYPVSFRGNKRFMDPPVPMNYFGNAIHLPVLSARAGDIKSRHVSYVARLIHDDIAKIDAEYIQSAIDWMEIQWRKGLQWGYNIDCYGGTDVNTTAFHTFPVYKTDFGWGKQLHYTLVTEPWFGDGVAYILPSPEGGRARKISLSMPGAVLERFLENNLVTRFTSNYPVGGGVQLSNHSAVSMASTTITDKTTHKKHDQEGEMEDEECYTNDLIDTVVFIHNLLLNSKL